MIYEEKTIETIPVGPLGLIPLKSCDELGEKVNQDVYKRQLQFPYISRPAIFFKFFH